MATEVFRSQICFVDRIRNSPAVFQRRRNGHRKSKRSSSDDVKTANNVAVGKTGMEKVTILRRGAKVKPEKSPYNKNGDMAIQKPNKITVEGDVYAGSATSVLSPAPSSLPFPSFSWKKKSQIVPIDDSATRDLRRLLRLEL